MKKFYLAVTVCQDKNESIFEQAENRGPEPGYYAYVIPVSESDNVKSRLETIGGLVHANICSTKKRADEIVNHWNESYKANGTYLFHAPLF